MKCIYTLLFLISISYFSVFSENIDEVIFSDGLIKLSDTKLQGDYSLSGFFVSSASANNNGLLSGNASAKTLTTSTKCALSLPSFPSIRTFKFWVKAADANPPVIQVRRQVNDGAWEVIHKLTETSTEYTEVEIPVNTTATQIKLQLYIEKTNTQAGYYFDDFILTGCDDCIYTYAGLAPIFTDNMILQRDKIVNIWGTASIDDLNIDIEIQGKKYSTISKGGAFSFELNPLITGGPFEMKLSWEGGTKTYSNIYVGDVWIAGGQSNMDFAMRKVTNAEEEMFKANYPLIRYYRVPKDYYEGHNKVTGDWESCTPEKISEAFAVPYYFAHEVFENQSIPIGIIQCGLGGTSAESWMSREVLLSDDRFSQELLDYDNIVNNYAPGEYEELLAQYNAGKISTEPIGYKNFRRPAGMYYTMFKKILPFTAKGILFYQGESNAKRGYNYRYLFPALIDLWKNDLQQPDLPTLFVQLPKFGASINWGDIRESQLIVSQTKENMGMVVAFDQGNPNNIHPTQKDTIGIRLGKLALATIYGKDIPYSGPQFKSMKIDNSKCILEFDNIYGGLIAKNGNGKLKGFTICGQDKVFKEAQAYIENNTVIVQHTSVPYPVSVRYGWFSSGEINLYNSEDFPASPFRTDNFKLPTQDEEDPNSIINQIEDKHGILINKLPDGIALTANGTVKVYTSEGILICDKTISKYCFIQLDHKGIYIIVVSDKEKTLSRKILF